MGFMVDFIFSKLITYCECWRFCEGIIAMGVSLDYITLNSQLLILLCIMSQREKEDTQYCSSVGQ